MNIYQLTRELEKMRANIVIAAQSALNSVIPSLIVDFKSRSPVDTGEYKSSWNRVTSRFSAPGVIAGASIRNDDPKASLMEFGADPDSAPWYYPGSKSRKRTGKLTVSGGRVWAGGLAPGHASTIGGAINSVLYNNDERQLKIANLIANKIIGAI